MGLHQPLLAVREEVHFLASSAWRDWLAANIPRDRCARGSREFMQKIVQGRTRRVDWYNWCKDCEYHDLRSSLHEIVRLAGNEVLGRLTWPLYPEARHVDYEHYYMTNMRFDYGEFPWEQYPEAVERLFHECERETDEWKEIGEDGVEGDETAMHPAWKA